MIRARKGRMYVSGIVFHRFADFPDDVEVENFWVELRGPGLPADLQGEPYDPPPNVSWVYREGEGAEDGFHFERADGSAT